MIESLEVTFIPAVEDELQEFIKSMTRITNTQWRLIKRFTTPNRSIKSVILEAGNKQERFDFRGKWQISNYQV